MDPETRKRLLALNRDFYTREAEAFSATRNHPWPGWVRILDGLAPGALAVLDAGCGNGRLARFLLERALQQRTGRSRAKQASGAHHIEQ